MNRNSEKEFRNRIIVRHKHSFLVVSKVALYLVLIALLDLSRIFANAKTKLDRDFYSSSGELVDVFRMEQDLVQVLDSHKRQIEGSLAAIHDYVSQVKQVYQNENCWPPKECPDEILMENIVGNPIYCYQILKRFNVDWKKMEKEIKELDAEKTARDLKRVKRRYGGLPKEEDLQGAARALNRLQTVYRFNVTEFSRGNIMGLQTSAELSVKDTFYLGRYAHMQNKPEVAIKWLEEAAIQAAADKDSAVQESQVQQVMRTVKRRLPPGYYDIESEFDDETLEDEDGRPKYRLGHIPAKTTDMRQQINEYDQANLDALCRGVDILPASERAKLICYYSSENDPYFLINPLKVEVAHRYPHEVLLFHDVVSDSEAGGIINEALPRIQRAPVGSSKEISEIRTSKNTWIEDSTSDLVDKISLRINWITGLQTTRKYDEFNEGKKEEYEYLQVANYGIGGHYGAHQDPMFVYKEPTDKPVMNIEEDGHLEKDSYVTGDRMSTFMVYLTEVPRGGHTAFPRLGVSVAPVRGMAVFWNNIRRSGRSDMHMLHGGCPVLLGSKWIANKWVREWANAFKHKCLGHVDY